MGVQSKWKNFTKEELEQFVKDSKSYAQIATKIGYKGGSGPTQVKQMIEYYDFDISHFTGQGWNKGNFDYSRFKYGNNIKTAQALDALVALRGHKCESCGLETWLNQKIPLEMHHKDGNHLNSELDNLELLCPNCHALTDNWRGKNNAKQQRKDRMEISDEAFVKALQENKNVRQTLLALGLSAAGGNYARAYDLAAKYNITHILK